MSDRAESISKSLVIRSVSWACGMSSVSMLPSVFEIGDPGICARCVGDRTGGATWDSVRRMKDMAELSRKPPSRCGAPLCLLNVAGPAFLETLS